MSFDPGDGANDIIRCLVIQDDGKILIGGEFTEYDGVTRNHIARLNADGSLDSSFDPGDGADDRVNSIALQSDGKILVGGDFEDFDGNGYFGITRLNTDGSLDNTFMCSGITDNSQAYVSDIEVDENDRILVGGNFVEMNDTSQLFVTRLTPSGHLDASFDHGDGPDNVVQRIAFGQDGDILIGGRFSEYDGTERIRLARLNEDGSLDGTFDAEESTGNAFFQTVYDFYVEENGKILVGGAFVDFNDSKFDNIVRLNKSGSVDDSFDTDADNTSPFYDGPTGAVYGIDKLLNGKYIAVGFFGRFNQEDVNFICTINADGSLDSTYTPELGTDSLITDVAVQSDGKIIIVGRFDNYDETSRIGIARLNATAGPTSLNDRADQGDLAIYPNPSRDHFNVNCPREVTITVSSVLGNTVSQFELSSGEHQIDTRSLQDGTYWIRCEDANGVMSSSMLIVTH